MTTQRRRRGDQLKRFGTPLSLLITFAGLCAFWYITVDALGFVNHEAVAPVPINYERGITPIEYERLQLLEDLTAE
jgi:hypothetical protein